MRYRLEIYADAAGQHRWRLVAPNGRIIADGAEGYATRSNAVRAAQRVVTVIRACLIDGVDE